MSRTFPRCILTILVPFFALCLPHLTSADSAYVVTSTTCPGTFSTSTNTCTLTQNLDTPLSIEASNLTLDGGGFTLSGTNHITSGDTGITITNATNVTIQNITLNSLFKGIALTNSSNITIKNAVIDAETGISLNTTTDSLIDSNTITATTAAIIIDAPLPIDFSETAHNTLSNNTITNGGIYLRNAGESTITNNAITARTGTGLTLFHTDQVTVKDNTITTTQPNAYGVSFVPFSPPHTPTPNDSHFDNNTVNGNHFEVLYDATTFTPINKSDTSGLVCIRCHDLTISGFTFKENSIGLMLIDSNNVTVKDNHFDNNYFSIGSRYSNQLRIYHNDFTNYGQVLYDSEGHGGYFSFNEPLPVGGNYYDEYNPLFTDCPDIEPDGFCDSSKPIKEGVWDYAPFKHPINNRCCSSVVFIPGFQASRLYQPGTLFENQLWEPNRNNDALALLMDINGNSIAKDIYTRDIIDESNVFTPDGIGVNIYKEFIYSMNGLVANNTIASWIALPYDWRNSLTSIIESPTSTNGSSFLAEIEKQAAASKTGKVTIIGHSNGGLLGKLLIKKLAEQGKAHLVDQFIMVGTPQLGTPSAVSGMLHGYQQDLPKSLGFLLSKQTARQLAQNMPGAYGLLPFNGYLNAITDPIITFASSTLTQKWRTQYGNDINTTAELKSFLLGGDGRSNPPVHDTLSPNVLNTQLFNAAESVSATLENWHAPESIKVHQVVGWGLDTVKGFTYSEWNDCWTNTSVCVKRLDQRPQFTVEGDGTVVYRSANYMQSDKTYYFNLENHNTLLVTDREHADILESKPVQTLLEMIIRNDLSVLPQHISTKKEPPADANARLRLSIHSPVSIGITDSTGNYTGLRATTTQSDLQRIVEEIPNSYYMEFGEGKYIGVDTADTYTVSLTGTDTGTFTLTMAQVAGDTETKKLEYKDIPVTKDTKASLTSLTTTPLLTVDYNGDGKNDFTALPNTTETATSTLIQFTVVVNATTMPKLTKTLLLAEVKIAEAFLKKKEIRKATVTLQGIRLTLALSQKVITKSDLLILDGLVQKVLRLIK